MTYLIKIPSPTHSCHLKLTISSFSFIGNHDFRGLETFHLCALAEHTQCGSQTLAAIPATPHVPFALTINEYIITSNFTSTLLFSSLLLFMFSFWNILSLHTWLTPTQVLLPHKACLSLSSNKPLPRHSFMLSYPLCSSLYSI